jgi:hypothetical protein
MDFIHRPKSKILKILKNLKPQRFGCWLCFRPQVNGRGGEKNTYSIGVLLYSIGILLFSPSIHLKTEAEPASETL